MANSSQKKKNVARRTIYAWCAAIRVTTPISAHTTRTPPKLALQASRILRNLRIPHLELSHPTPKTEYLHH